MKILVTGGNGFIGTKLSSMLKRVNHDVTVVDVKPPVAATPLSKQQVKTVELYMEELKTLETNPLVYGKQAPFDVIFHLAATPRIGVGLVEPEKVLSNNINSLIAALSYCRRNPSTKLIFISSSSAVWSDVSKNPYALSKKIGEELLGTYIGTYGVNAVIARLYNVYGPGEADCGNHTTLIKQCKKCYVSNQPLIVRGDGSVCRDFTHVDDVVAGLVAIMVQMESQDHPRLFEIGAGMGCVTVNQVIEAFGEPLKVTYTDSVDADAPKTLADFGLWPSGWKAKISVLDHIAEWRKTGRLSD
jgi:UDP-glucose 4-epimerase